MALSGELMLDRAPAWVRRAVTAVMQGRGPLGAVVDRIVHRPGDARIPRLPDLSSAPTRLVIGPANEAEQGYQWARAYERATPGLAATAVMGIDPGGYDVRADIVVPTPVYLRSAPWHDEFERYILDATHVIHESGLPLLGRRYGDAFSEAERFRAAGLTVGAMFHGSDLRIPSRHALQSEWSPFTDPAVPSRLFEDRARRNLAGVRALGIPAFVSTPDLLQYLPEATWCPVVIDPSEWATPHGRTPGRERPVVLHAPSSSRMKGSERIEPVLRALHDEGLIEYRRVAGVKHERMKQQYAEADIVLEQFLIGSYGVAACEAMAAGCVVIGHVDDATRETVTEHTGLDVPIVEATVRSLEETLRALVAEPGAWSMVRSAGAEFVSQVHDGRYSGAAVGSFFGAD